MHLLVLCIKKFILKSDTPYKQELMKPKLTLTFVIYFIICKINSLYIKYVYNFNNRNRLNFKKTL